MMDPDKTAVPLADTADEKKGDKNENAAFKQCRSRTAG